MVRWHTLIGRDVRKQAALIRKPAAHDHLHRFEMIKGTSNNDDFVVGSSAAVA
jgi:hypothetical protein